jgi:hypothetical protein
MGFRLVIRFIEHLENVTTSKYSTIANSNTLQFTAAGTNKPSQFAVSAPVVVWRRLPTPQIPQFPYSLPYWPASVSQLTKL